MRRILKQVWTPRECDTRWYSVQSNKHSVNLAMSPRLQVLSPSCVNYVPTKKYRIVRVTVVTVLLNTPNSSVLARHFWARVTVPLLKWDQDQYILWIIGVYILKRWLWPGLLMVLQMVPWRHVGEGSWTLDDGEGQEWFVSGARVAGAAWGVRAVGAGARSGHPCHD